MLLQFNTMMKAAATKNGLQLRLATHSFIKDFEQIRPAAIIQSKTGDLTEFDAFITFLKKQVTIRPLPFQSFSQISVDGTRLLWLIFHPQLASATVSTTWMVPVQAHWYAGAISLGGIIATILAYVGYRKYRMV
jgi:hypothetical protein